MEHIKRNIFITGAGGYVGRLLADYFSKMDHIEIVVCLDKDPMPSFLEGNKKIFWIQKNVADDSWQEAVASFSPFAVVHLAWQIREMYGKKELQKHWNIDGTKNVFDFAFTTPSVKNLIHYSSVASYSARPDNSMEYSFTEESPLRESGYLYADQKRESEQLLESMAKAYQQQGGVKSIYVIRPASITGPYGRNMHIRLGLQSALSGKATKGFVQKLISKVLVFAPFTKTWSRQFVHEDDMVHATALLAQRNSENAEYEIFNLCPPGPIVTGRDMAYAVGKRAIMLPPILFRIIFSIAWYFSCGKIPTSPGGWKSYAYPVVVDGSKITKKLGYTYFADSHDSFTKNVGKYAV
jgi:nucleoside-diphosphate-sugar epimerase